MNFAKDRFKQMTGLLVLFSYLAAPALLIYLAPCILFLAPPTAMEATLGFVLFYALGWNFGAMQEEWEAKGCELRKENYSLVAISGIAFVWYAGVIYVRTQILDQPLDQFFPMILLVPPVVAFLAKLLTDFFLHRAAYNEWLRQKRIDHVQK